eukprot:2538760-Alexandrium_andersonii.AAC.1
MRASVGGVRPRADGPAPPRRGVRAAQRGHGYPHVGPVSASAQWRGGCSRTMGGWSGRSPGIAGSR